LEGGRPEASEWTSGCRLAKGADLLIHDAQYTSAERSSRIGWGHSSLDEAMAFAEMVEARVLAPFHYDPTHSDAELDALFSRVERRAVELLPAAEGLTVDIGRRRNRSRPPTREDRPSGLPGSLPVPAGRAA
jgi:hypothetical protein